MKQIFKKIFDRKVQCRALTVFAVASAMLFGACARDLDEQGSVNGDVDGVYSIVIPCTVPQASDRTRAQSVDDTGIERLWIGLFKITDTDAVSRGDIDSNAALIKSWEMSNVAADSNLKLIIADPEYLFGDDFKNNTSVKYCMVAVANFHNIPGHRVKDGVVEDGYLFDMLRSIVTWGDFCSLAADTKVASEQRYPLMQGLVVSANDAASHMILPETCGLLTPATTGNSQRTFTAAELLNFKHGQRPALYLRRLISQITVNVTPDFSGSDYTSVKVDNVRYAVVNCPKTVYLQERVVPADVSGRDQVPTDVFTDLEEYKTYSPNYEDWSADGFYNTIDEAAFTKVDGVYTKKPGETKNHKFSFNYTRFESKHTSAEALSTYTDREEVKDGRFTALCPDAGALYNNYAPYFVLMADLELDKGDGKPLYVTARYVIHEGYANNYDGSRLDDTNTTVGNNANYLTRLRDFSCIRNTKYTYTVTIKGVNSILVSVKMADGNERNGVTGDVSTVIGSVVFDGIGLTEDNKPEYAFTLTNAGRRAVAGKWLVVAPWRAKNEDGEWEYKHVEYGHEGIVVPKFSTVQSFGGDNFYPAVDVDDNELNQFCNWVTFYDEDDKEIGNIAAFAAAADIEGEDDNTTHTYKLKVEPYKWKGTYQYAFDGNEPSLTGSRMLNSWHNPEEDTRALWLCTDFRTSANGSTYENILSVIQTVDDDRPVLPAPSVEAITQPVYVYERVEVGLDVAANANNREGVDHYVVTTEDGTFEVPFAETGSIYQFRGPLLDIYGTTKTITVTSHPANLAEYAVSEPNEYQYMVFTRFHTWLLGAQQYPKLSTTDSSFSDWCDLSSSLAVRGNNIRQVMNDSGKENGYIQIGAAANIENKTNMFSMWIPESGSVHVRFSNTGNNGPRYVALYADGKEYISTYASTTNTTQIDAYFNIELTENKPTQIYIYSPSSKNSGGLRYYQIDYSGEFRYERTRWTWNFSSEEWSEVMQDLIAAGTTGSNDYDVTFDDLRITAGTVSMRAGVVDGVYYYQTGGGGSMSKRVFSFNALSSGTLKVTTTNTGSTADMSRMVCVQTGSNTANKQEKAGGYPSNAPTTLYYKITVTEPETIYIYSTNGLRFYEIEFISDLDENPETPIEPSVWNFAQEPWKSNQAMKDLIAKESNSNDDRGDANFDLTLDGLRVYAGGAVMRANTGYFQPMAPGGNKDLCSFSFTATTSGTVTVEASNTGSSEGTGRNIAVQTGDDASNKQSQFAGTPSTAAHTVATFHVDVSAPTPIYIYTEVGALRIYRIEYSGGIEK